MMANPGIISPKAKPVPPLEPGDQLSREEFERRYDAMPNLKKAELIEGEVYMPSPVRWEPHANPDAHLGTWMCYYSAFTPGTSVGGNATVRMDLDNEPQPDGALIVLPEYGGAVEFEDGYVVGGPELLGEISASTVSIDLTKKYKVYRRNQVQEYIVWRVQDSAIDWFVLRNSLFIRLPLGPDGIYRSEVFPGLWLDAAALVGGDMAKVLQVLRQGLATPEHAAFVAKLQQNFSTKSHT
jgi:hypothetical protein